MVNINNIPDKLLNLDHFQEDVSILIGENGSGKSILLNKLSKHFLRNNNNVVAIANSIHDKFESNHRNFKSLRGRSGRRQTRSTIKNALSNIAESDIQLLKNASRALQYVGFEPKIGFKIDRLNPLFKEILLNSDLNTQDKEQIAYLIDKTINESRFGDIIWLEVDNYSFNEISKSVLTELFLWELKLKKLKIISRIEVFLQKNQTTISMLAASSGELALITSIVYLSTVITENTVILIDEPENSLHPKWQKEYVKILFDIFYLYQPKIVIATHSPLIVNGAELFVVDPQIYKADRFTFEIQGKEPLNVEELLFRFFDITTPQNRFMSDRILRYLNLLSYKKISLRTFEIEMDKIKVSTYDPQQLKLLQSIATIALEISSTKIS